MPYIQPLSSCEACVAIPGKTHPLFLFDDVLHQLLFGRQQGSLPSLQRLPLFPQEFLGHQDGIILLGNLDFYFPKKKQRQYDEKLKIRVEKSIGFVYLNMTMGFQCDVTI